MMWLVQAIARPVKFGWLDAELVPSGLPLYYLIGPNHRYHLKGAQVVLQDIARTHAVRSQRKQSCSATYVLCLKYLLFALVKAPPRAAFFPSKTVIDCFILLLLLSI